jgi:hypothetical protein
MRNRTCYTYRSGEPSLSSAIFVLGLNRAQHAASRTHFWSSSRALAIHDRPKKVSHQLDHLPVAWSAKTLNGSNQFLSRVSSMAELQASTLLTSVRFRYLAPILRTVLGRPSALPTPIGGFDPRRPLQFSGLPPNTYPAPPVSTQRSGFYPLVIKAIVGFLNRWGRTQCQHTNAPADPARSGER